MVPPSFAPQCLVPGPAAECTAASVSSPPGLGHCRRAVWVWVERTAQVILTQPLPPSSGETSSTTALRHRAQGCGDRKDSILESRLAQGTDLPAVSAGGQQSQVRHRCAAVQLWSHGREPSSRQPAVLFENASPAVSHCCSCCSHDRLHHWVETASSQLPRESRSSPRTTMALSRVDVTFANSQDASCLQAKPACGSPAGSTGGGVCVCAGWSWTTANPDGGPTVSPGTEEWVETYPYTTSQILGSKPEDSQDRTRLGAEAAFCFLPFIFTTDSWTESHACPSPCSSRLCKMGTETPTLQPIPQGC